MSEIFKLIKADLTKARLAKNVLETNTLRTLVGDIELAMTRPGAESLDAVTQSTLTAFSKNAKLCESQAREDLVKWTKNAEVAIYQRYMPRLMSETHIREIISHQFGEKIEAKQKGDIMKFMKANHTGQYDGAVVSALITQLIATTI